MSADEKKLLYIPLNLIQENPVALRTVNRTSEEYLGLVASIKADGVLNAITVREIKKPDTGEMIYGLIDGLHRFTASMDAGRETIPAQVVAMDDGKVLEAQILANVHKVETKPIEYTRQLVRLLAMDPLMPLNQLAAKLSKSPTWLSERLGLIKLTKQIGDLVDEGTVNLTNAYSLAKLPEEEQLAFLDRAMTMSPSEFIPTVNARAKELRDARRQGRAATTDEFIPVAHARKVGELKAEVESGEVGKVLITELKITKPEDAFTMGVKWALHLDPSSVAAAKAKDEQRKAEKEAAAAKRKEEQEAKKAKEAAEKQSNILEQLQKAGK